MQNKRWGQARREVSGLKPEIESHLKSGGTIRQIWLALKAEGKVSVTLSNFYVQVARLLDGAVPLSPSRRVRHARLPVPVSPPLPTVSSPSAEAGSSDDDPHFQSFTHNKHPDLDDGSW